jgi:hypothetical protein
MVAGIAFAIGAAVSIAAGSSASSVLGFFIAGAAMFVAGVVAAIVGIARS